MARRSIRKVIGWLVRRKNTPQAIAHRARIVLRQAGKGLLAGCGGADVLLYSKTPCGDRRKAAGKRCPGGTCKYGGPIDLDHLDKGARRASGEDDPTSQRD